ncbi:hypothetical protein [Rossellomorea marisflavi]|uniref:hypothetical protein n=1 Tax=Rossellomorea marisflavi TaxID=189381 RepID=UPI003F9FAB56
MIVSTVIGVGSLAIGVFVGGKVTKKSETNTVTPIELDMIASPQTKEEKRARMWEQALVDLGESPDFALLKKEASYKAVPNDCITYEAVMTEKEFNRILKWVGGKESEKGYNGWFDFEALPSAVQAKKLVFLMDRLSESVQLLKEKANSSGLTEAGESKKLILEKDLKKRQEELKHHVPSLNERKEQMKFSKVAFREESDLLDTIDNLVKEGEDALETPVNQLQMPTSLPLLELNQFLNENELPEEVSQELKKTMRQIKEKLSATNEEKEREQVLLNAVVLNDSAKLYHDIQ